MEAITSKGVVNIRVQVFAWIYVFISPGKSPGGMIKYIMNPKATTTTKWQRAIANNQTKETHGIQKKGSKREKRQQKSNGIIRQKIRW